MDAADALALAERRARLIDMRFALGKDEPLKEHLGKLEPRPRESADD